jgi:hypothetical protein
MRDPDAVLESLMRYGHGSMAKLKGKTDRELLDWLKEKNPKVNFDGRNEAFHYKNRGKMSQVASNLREASQWAEITTEPRQDALSQRVRFFAMRKGGRNQGDFSQKQARYREKISAVQETGQPVYIWKGEVYLPADRAGRVRRLDGRFGPSEAAEKGEKVFK